MVHNWPLHKVIFTLSGLPKGSPKKINSLFMLFVFVKIHGKWMFIALHVIYGRIKCRLEKVVYERLNGLICLKTIRYRLQWIKRNTYPKLFTLIYFVWANPLGSYCTSGVANGAFSLMLVSSENSTHVGTAECLPGTRQHLLRFCPSASCTC